MIYHKRPLMLSLSKHARWAGLLALGACAQPASDPPVGEKIECALDGDVNFTAVCTLERNANLLILRRPDGGFRRVEMLAGGAYGVIDGADEAHVSVDDSGRTLIVISSDLFRLPTDAVRP